MRNIVAHYRARTAGLSELFERHGLDPQRHCIKAELTDESDVKQLRALANERFGRIWGLVNLAGGSSNRLIWKMTKTDFEDVVANNLMSAFLCLREFAPDFREHGGGRVINVSSIAAFTGAAGASHYCAAKAGVVGFTRAAALELAPKTVTVNVLALGYFDQGIIDHVPANIQDEIRARTPLKRLGIVSEAAAAIDYLLSQHAAFVTGQVLHINGGLYG